MVELWYKYAYLHGWKYNNMIFVVQRLCGIFAEEEITTHMEQIYKPISQEASKKWKTIAFNIAYTEMQYK